MTNEEAMEWINSTLYEEAPVIQKAILTIIQENTKLKAEIEQLKEEVNVNKCWSDVVEKTLKKEIDKNLELKSELEQSAKLPYLAGTPLYFAFSKQGIVKDKIRRWQINEHGIVFYSKGSAYPVEFIGKYAFLTREEAEQSLKGAING